jgi:hypothetical protein
VKITACFFEYQKKLRAKISPVGKVTAARKITYSVPVGEFPGTTRSVSFERTTE